MIDIQYIISIWYLLMYLITYTLQNMYIYIDIALKLM